MLGQERRRHQSASVLQAPLSRQLRMLGSAGGRMRRYPAGVLAEE